MGLSGSDQTCQNNFPTCQNVRLFAPTKIFSAHPEIISAPPILGPHLTNLGPQLLMEFGFSGIENPTDIHGSWGT